MAKQRARKPTLQVQHLQSEDNALATSK